MDDGREGAIKGRVGGNKGTRGREQGNTIEGGREGLGREGGERAIRGRKR